MEKTDIDIKNNLCVYVYVNKPTQLCVCLIACPKKKYTSEIGLEFLLVFFPFFNFFIKSFIQEHNLRPDPVF